MIHLSLKQGGLELRTCDKHLLQSGDPSTCEILANDDHIVIAYWVINDESINLQFVDNRPFNLTDDYREVFWHLAEYGQRFLEKYTD